MAMSKRFFIKLAAEYRALRPITGSDQYSFDIWESMVRATAGMLKTQNSMFNFDRFYEACGIEAGR